MTTFKIAASNMARNLEQYLVYFITVTISVLIFFTFLSLGNNLFLTEILTNWSVGGKVLFKSSAFLLLIFIICFIFYSNNYFIQRRKREFGLYSLLGLRKIQIVEIIIIESLLLYALALLLGIIMGILFSKLFIMLLLWVINLRVDAHLMISFKAIWETIIVFFFILALIALYSTFFIFKNRLILLFQTEVNSFQKTKRSFFPTMLGLFLIIFGYWLALQKAEESYIGTLIGSIHNVFFLVLFSVIIGTLLIFRYGLPHVFHLFYKNPRFAYRGSNLVTLTLLRYQIEKNATILAIIAILSAVTLTVICTISSFYYVMLSAVGYENSASYQILNLSPVKQDKIEKIIDQNKKHHLIYKFNTEYTSFTTSKYKKFSPDEFGTDSNIVQIIPRQDFNRLSKLEKKGNPKINKLAKGEAILIEKKANYANNKKKEYAKEESLELKNIATKKKAAKLKIVGFRDNNVFYPRFAGNLLVVEDNYYKNVLQKEGEVTKVTTYDVSNSREAEELSKKIQIEVDGKLDRLESKVYNYFSDYHLISVLFGTFLYIGSFIGIVFFLATGSIIYFKQVTEAYDERRRFETLIKLGFTEKELQKVIRKQIAPLFLFPLLFGVLHSLIAIKTLSLSAIDYLNTAQIIIIMAVYCLFYIIYYLLCVRNYGRIVMRNHL